jgi:hypothetical protein
VSCSLLHALIQLNSSFSHFSYQVIHVEHDKVATHVYQHNHDRGYNPDLPRDGDIEHVYIEKFETLTNTLEAFCEKHGRE